VRAAAALLDYAFCGPIEADALRGEPATSDASPMDTEGVVQVLAARLRQVDAAELPTGENPGSRQRSPTPSCGRSALPW
jgi:hypothetical protein